MRLVPPTEVDPLIDAITEGLRYYRGAGHRSLIIAYVLAARRRMGAEVEADDVVAAFEANLGAGSDRLPFRLPFGEGSYRWALKEALDR